MTIRALAYINGTSGCPGATGRAYFYSTPGGSLVDIRADGVCADGRLGVSISEQGSGTPHAMDVSGGSGRLRFLLKDMEPHSAVGLTLAIHAGEHCECSPAIACGVIREYIIPCNQQVCAPQPL